MAKKLAVEKVLFVAIVARLGVGLVMVHSASAEASRSDAPVLPLLPFNKQLIAGVLGLGALLLGIHVDYRTLRRRAVVYTGVLVVLGMLIAVLSAPVLNGVRRWLFVAGFSFQPSELAKLVLVVFLAYQIERKRDRLASAACLVPCLGLLGIFAGLIVLQPDLGTAVVLVGVGSALLFLAGLEWRLFALGLAASLPAVLLLAFLREYQWQRITTFLDPASSDPLGEDWQINQSLIAVGSGGFFGRGLGESVQKLAFLPAANSDFIYAIVCEELGMIGSLAVLGLFVVVGWRGFRAGALAPDAFGRYLAWGLSTMVVLQSFLHMSIALRLLPTTGITLPFISNGGSSLILTLFACGLILNVSQHA